VKRTGEREVRMKEYMKPVLLTSDELAEGVYLASGDGSGCYTTTAYIHQTPQTGRGDYRIQVNAVHNADHTKEAQQLIGSGTCNLKCECYGLRGRHRIIQAGMEAPEDTDSSSDVWDVRHIQLQPVDSRRIMWIRDMLEVTILIMETASHPGKRKDMDRMIQ